MEVRHHPLFVRWLEEMADQNEEVFGELMALLEALEDYGHELEDEQREESHPVLSSRFDMHALRRTPPSQAAPFADSPPVLRILYAICRTTAGAEVAVALLGGDKTTLGSDWYPVNLAEAEHRLTQFCQQHSDLTAIVKRGNR